MYIDTLHAYTHTLHKRMFVYVYVDGRVYVCVCMEVCTHACR